MAAFSYRFVICVVLVNLAISIAPDAWRYFNTVMSEKSRFHVLHDWPSSEGSYRDDYSDPFTAFDVSDIMLQTMGIYKRTLDWQGVQVKNLFNRPHATALFILDGLADAPMIESSKTYSVNQHKLLGDFRSDMLTMFQGDSILRYFTWLFDGKGVSLSLSGDGDTAEEIGTARSAIKPDTFFDELSSLQEDFTMLQHVEFPIPATVDVGTGKVTIDTGNEKASFDLRDQIDLLLFTELAAMMKVIDSLNEEVNDGIPDVYVLAVSSLQVVRAKYGSSSVQFRLASQLAVACVKKMSDQLVGLYDGNIISQLLSLVWEEQLLERSTEGVSVDDPTDICDYVFSEEPANFVACLGTMCESVECSGVTLNRLRRDVNVEAETQGSPCNVCPTKSYSRTENFSAMFGIIAFITIVLVAVTFGISWSMWMMDPGQDSIIYQMTTPRVKID